MRHGLAVPDGHDLGGVVLSDPSAEPSGFWHVCPDDTWVRFEWQQLDPKEFVPNPIEGDTRLISGRWVVARKQPPRPYRMVGDNGLEFEVIERG